MSTIAEDPTIAPAPKAWNEDSGRFPALIDLERPEESPDFFDDIAAVGAQIDAQLAHIYSGNGGAKV